MCALADRDRSPSAQLLGMPAALDIEVSKMMSWRPILAPLLVTLASSLDQEDQL